MRSTMVLSKFLWDEITRLRMEQCIGCQYSHGSQKHHFICMSDWNHGEFRKNAILNLKATDLITQEEYNFLDKNKLNN